MRKIIFIVYFSILFLYINTFIFLKHIKEILYEFSNYIYLYN